MQHPVPPTEPTDPRRLSTGIQKLLTPRPIATTEILYQDGEEADDRCPSLSEIARVAAMAIIATGHPDTIPLPLALEEADRVLPQIMAYATRDLVALRAMARVPTEQFGDRDLIRRAASNAASTIVLALIEAGQIEHFNHADEALRLTDVIHAAISGDVGAYLATLPGASKREG